MNLQFYANESDERYLIKSIIKLDGPFTVKYKEDTELTHPTFIVRAVDYNRYSNYVHIGHTEDDDIVDSDLVDRYYYIRKVTFSQMYVYLECEVDVLMSHPEAVLAVKGVIDRNSKVWNMYLNDDRMELYNMTRTLTFPFPSGFRDYYNTNKKASFVLTVSGSGT